MANIIDYVKNYGNDSFVKRPFCAVDSLILSGLSYLIYDGFVPPLSAKKRSVGLSRFSSLDIEKLIISTLTPLRNKNLLKALQESKRFGKMRLNYFINDFNPNEDTQFSAITFLLVPHKLSYIAFRGTDLTFIGWKEDFNMAIMSETPSQKRSVLYLDKVASLLEGDLIVGGHSKGGNLAYYSSFYCKKKTQDRLIAVYNHDGPGFRDNLYSRLEYQRIATRLHKTVPNDSIIGILLNYDQNYRIVKSNMVGLLQHDMFTWEIKDTDFVYKTDRTHNSHVMDKTLSDWLASADDETRAICIKELFDILTAGNSVAFADLKKDTLKKLTLMFRQFAKVDRKTKEILIIILSNLIHTWFKHILRIPLSKRKPREKKKIEMRISNSIKSNK